MASKRRAKPSLTYFYWDGHLCRRLTISRMENLLYAWDYTANRRVSILLSDFRRNKGVAFTTPAVARLTGMSLDRIYFALNTNKIEKPQRPIKPGEEDPEHKLHRKGYLWSEQDIMNLHDWLVSLHMMRPRNDGLPRRRPKIKSKAEIRAGIKGSPQIFVQNSEGEFVPVWKEL